MKSLQDVRENGDAAIRMYSEKWDGFAPENLRVTEEEIDEAVKDLIRNYTADLQEAADNIHTYHEAHKNEMAYSCR